MQAKLVVAVLAMLSLYLFSGSTTVAKSPLATVPPVQSEERILFIGDSLTAGLFATDERATFVSRVSAMIDAKIGRRLASQLYIADYVWSEAKVWKPTIVVIEVGLNDINGGTYSNQDWEALYKRLVLDIQGTGARVVICTTFHFNNKPTDADWNRRIEYNDMIRRTASETGASLADLWNATLICPDCVSSPDVASYFAPYYHGDNFHPSDYGHAVIAQTVYDAIFDKKMYFPVVSNQE